MSKTNPPSMFGAGLKAFLDLFKSGGGRLDERVAKAMEAVNKTAEAAAKTKRK
ncbi:MAG: hypothetical protein H6702_11685 [Myxococcales bacterium]|nr:hypothetical protein [Myxococcales bacterium]